MYSFSLVWKLIFHRYMQIVILNNLLQMKNMGWAGCSVYVCDLMKLRKSKELRICGGNGVNYTVFMFDILKSNSKTSI